MADLPTPDSPRPAADVSDRPDNRPHRSPLSAPAPRRHLHTRRVECQGFERDDGLYDIEARMTDVKSYSFENRFRGTVHAGEPVHEMWIRLTVDSELTVHAAEALTANSPFATCPQIARRYQRLVGAKIGSGWRRRLQELFSGVDGCTHLTELLGPLATTAFQTVFTRRRDKSAGEGSGSGGDDRQRRPPLLDSCHAYRSDGPVVRRQWPAFYTGEPERQTPAHQDDAGGGP